MAQRFSKPFYNSVQWKVTREYILKRDNYLCVQCDKPAEEVHHVVWLTPKNIIDSDITINSSNLISLCRDCHMNIHKGQRGKAHIGEKQYEVGKEYIFDVNGMLVKKADTPL